MLQAKIMNKFHADNSLLPSQIEAILPCKQSLLIPPLPTQTFLLRPKRIGDPNIVRKPVLWPQHPKVVYHGTSDPSTYDVAPVAQPAEVAATNDLLLYSDVTTGVFICCIEGTKTSTHSPGASWVKLNIRILSVFHIFFLFERTFRFAFAVCIRNNLSPKQLGSNSSEHNILDCSRHDIQIHIPGSGEIVDRVWSFPVVLFVPYWKSEKTWNAKEYNNWQHELSGI